MPVHHPSQVGFAQPCEAFYGGDLEEEEEEGEIELELEEAVVVRMSGRRAQNGLLTLLSWSPSRTQPPMNGPIQLLLLLLEREPQVLLREDCLARLVDAQVLGDDETHVRQIHP